MKSAARLLPVLAIVLVLASAPANDIHGVKSVTNRMTI